MAKAKDESPKTNETAQTDATTANAATTDAAKSDAAKADASAATAKDASKDAASTTQADSKVGKDKDAANAETAAKNDANSAKSEEPAPKDSVKSKEPSPDKAKAKPAGAKKQGNGLRALFAGFILAFIAIGCTVGVLYVQNTTQETIMANRQARETELMQSMLPGIEKEAQGKVTYDCRIVTSPYIGNKMRLYIAKDSRPKTLGYIVSYSTNRGYSNPLIFIAGVNPDLTIRRVDVQLSKETPGLGDKVEQRKGNYMDQFVGKSLTNANWEVKKFNGDFDYFTGATVTSRAVVLATHDLLKGLNEIDIEALPKCPVTQGGS